MSKTKKTSARVGVGVGPVSYRVALGWALYFAVFMSLVEVLDVFLDTGELTVTARTTYTFGFWLLGGGIIGYVAWKGGRKE